MASELHKHLRQVSPSTLDEPTTGLHTEDVRYTVLSHFVDDGNTVLVIEHNLDVIKTADHIIDLGQKVVSVAEVLSAPEEVAASEAPAIQDSPPERKVTS